MTASVHNEAPLSRIIPDPVEAAASLPGEVDVVVIGGGIIGVSCAYYLAQKGMRVALCEKGLIGAEQSSRNWGWVRQMGRNEAEIPLSVQSLRLWRGLNEALGMDTGFRQTGITYLCRTHAEMAEYEKWKEAASIYQVETRILGKADLPDVLPGVADGFVGGMYTASDGRAEPSQSAPAIARGAVQLGAHVMTRCAVRSIETAGGSVYGVITEHGPIRCRQVVLAGGSWSRLFAGNLGVDLPSLKVLGSVARISSVDGVSDMPVGASNFAFRRRLDGGFTLAQRNANAVPIVPDSFRLFTDFSAQLITSWKELKLRLSHRFLEELRTARHWQADAVTIFEKIRVLDPDPNPRFLQGGLEHLGRAFPAFQNSRITHSWGGLIDTTPDAVPVIGPVERIPGFFIASGFSGHGFGIGPGSGQMVAQMIAGEDPFVDPTPFRLERFARLRRTIAGAAAA